MADDDDDDDIFVDAFDEVGCLRRRVSELESMISDLKKKRAEDVKVIDDLRATLAKKRRRQRVCP